MKGFPQFLYMTYAWQPKPVPLEIDLSGQTAMITGANSGLGFETAMQLASHGVSRLILAVRNIKTGEDAKQKILQSHGNCDVQVWPVDSSDYDSLVRCGEEALKLSRLDIVILNSGVRKLRFNVTEKTGHEENIQVNHLGTAFLSLQLLPALVRTSKQISKPTRLTIVSSIVHQWTPFDQSQPPSWTPNMIPQWDEQDSMGTGPSMDRYHTTKLLNVIWMRQLADYVSDKEVTINAVNPGLCKSALHRHDESFVYKMIVALFGWTPTQGGHCIVDAVASQNSASHGKYVSEQEIKEPSEFVTSSVGKKAQAQLWNETLEVFRREITGWTLPRITAQM